MLPDLWCSCCNKKLENSIISTWAGTACNIFIYFFKNYFSNLSHNLVSKLPLSPNIFTESKIGSYYDNNAVSKDLNFQLSKTSPEKILIILTGLNSSKTAGIDNSSGKFLKDGVHVLARPISQLCNLSIKLSSFPRSCKITKVKPLFKKRL